MFHFWFNRAFVFVESDNDVLGCCLIVWNMVMIHSLIYRLKIIKDQNRLHTTVFETLVGVFSLLVSKYFRCEATMIKCVRFMFHSLLFVLTIFLFDTDI